MESKKRARSLPLDTQSATVSMLEVDQNVAKVFAMAKERPVKVLRYRTPFAVILSMNMWLGSSKLEDFVPRGSPLRAVKSALELLLVQHEDELSALSICSKMEMTPLQAIRILLLQVLHSIQTESVLHDQIKTNMSFRWFVGLGISAALWDCSQFVQDLRTLTESATAVELLLKTVQYVVSKERAGVDFNINVALARAWALRHPSLRHRVPLDDYDGSRLILMP